MKGQEQLFSTGNGEYGTPQDLFDSLNEEFNFTLDPCATEHNAKVPYFFTKEIDGLSVRWTIPMGRGFPDFPPADVFMNPPYGEPENPCKPNCIKKRCVKRGYHVDTYQPGIIDWMKKAQREWRCGCTVVCLVPARTCTKWWHECAMRAHEIRFIEGRLTFEAEEATINAPFPSAIVIFRKFVCADAPLKVYSADRLGRVRRRADLGLRWSCGAE